MIVEIQNFSYVVTLVLTYINHYISFSKIENHGINTQ